MQPGHIESIIVNIPRSVNGECVFLRVTCGCAFQMGFLRSSVSAYQAEGHRFNPYRSPLFLLSMNLFLFMAHHARMVMVAPDFFNLMLVKAYVVIVSKTLTSVII